MVSPWRPPPSYVTDPMTLFLACIIEIFTIFGCSVLEINDVIQIEKKACIFPPSSLKPKYYICCDENTKLLRSSKVELNLSVSF